ncbi:alpha/beta hydrolase [Streptomyces sp. TRM66268-LWL]|uniref:Alpha/beta hydrolase n=1 Tax=Streptomyces polyasparticus TaxID=2767826 RepID=A0ABR7SB13_9ACTN|nr:alpha/beta fold hydrolase [Streptomyces polyasparticus]MBC9712670.1 alpha/beta hydrolase [Streptomyces polyasparticus]
MTRFVLVPGLFTGAQVWQETVERLLAAGAKAEVVEVPRQQGAAVDLDAHIAQVVAAIDAGGAGGTPDVVLVGHDYGVFPAVGAADRRADRVARIVYVDAPLVQDGATALATVPDPEVREQLAGQESLPVPDRDEWERWGSTAGLSDAHIDRLTALAAPQPAATLLQPLHLTGAAADLPTTGVLCAESGATIATVRMLVGFGDPALQALARPEVTFFELPTGHWPMLSRPADLAEALLSAAAGGGVSLSAADEPAETPGYLRPFLLDVPEIGPERQGDVDLFLPDADGPRPAVVIVHGGPVPAGMQPAPREWPTLVGYARYAASLGAVGVTLDHRLHDVADYPVAAADLAAAVEQVRADPRVDNSRIALWFFSGSGPMTADWLSAPPPWLRCLAANYPIMAPLASWGLAAGQRRPADVVAQAGALPLLLVRAGLETSAIAATVTEFVAAADAAGAALEIIDVPNGHHSFEGIDRTDESRAVIREAVRRVLGRLDLT